eukprot:CAMPEP_0197843368 /NCGR_PEP_ID=MMETSP1438-20131217/230_1 /TAXON_ID=1461541 /ORGANISM="Pterosperma sp., Strain CCMP1384" /LENGTH=413 /DNA_ID=CAMNT_0043453461 /DNA_START=45 /DNA_END=1287 /DNA_ORIENTATION=+
MKARVQGIEPATSSSVSQTSTRPVHSAIPFRAGLRLSTKRSLKFINSQLVRLSHLGSPNNTIGSRAAPTVRAAADAPKLIPLARSSVSSISTPELIATRPRLQEKKSSDCSTSYRASRWPYVEQLHSDPPIYVVHNFLPQGLCKYISTVLGPQGLVPELDYYGEKSTSGAVGYLNQHANFDATRLLPGLGVMCMMESAIHSFFHPDTTVINKLLHGAEFTGFVGVVAMAVLVAVNISVESSDAAVFTGTKYSLSSTALGQRVASALLAVTEAIFQVPAVRFEPVTLTRYRKGERQRVHNDARTRPMVMGAEDAQQWDHDLRVMGGQRMAQVLVYLSEVEGGGTTFTGLKGGPLTVHPEPGKALIFFPSDKDGTPLDIPHFGDAVTGDADKWTINTWMLQYEPMDGSDSPDGVV